MRPVKKGDIITLGDKKYIFSQGSALVFNTALAIKNNFGEWPKEAIVSLNILTRVGLRHREHYPFALEKVVKAVEKLQT